MTGTAFLVTTVVTTIDALVAAAILRRDPSEPIGWRRVSSSILAVIEALKPSSRVDLVVSGHAHGGQVQLPWFGPPITLSAVPRRVAAGGLHTVDGRRVYVSRGIGSKHGHAPRVRFPCTPEVTIPRLVR